MAYPINPPAHYHFLRKQLTMPMQYLGSGLWRDIGLGWYFWEPPWRDDRHDPNDWLVGPYPKARPAQRALKRFVDKEGEGPELRTWFP